MVYSMEYALVINVPAEWATMSEEERAALYREYEQLRDEPGYIGGAELAGTGTRVRVREDGAAIVTDGPFAEMKEVFGGYYIFELPDIESAVRLAARIPAARIGGSVDVRPVTHRA